MNITTRTLTATVSPPGTFRLDGIDGVRGFAMLSMLIDHLAHFIPNGEPLRLTIGRLAMPLFFLVAGSLVSKLNFTRLTVLAVIGIALPTVYVGWIDNPNVLLYYAIGAIIVYFLRTSDVALIVALAVCFTFAANFPLKLSPTSYPFETLLGFMLIGAILGRNPFHKLGKWARLIGPRTSWIRAIGRRPLSFYVGHLVIIESVRRVWEWGAANYGG